MARHHGRGAFSALFGLLLVVGFLAPLVAQASVDQNPTSQAMSRALLSAQTNHSAAGISDEVPPETEVSVLTKEIEPFIFGESGTPTGFSADLWNEIARRNGWTTKWSWTDSVSEQIRQVEERKVDVAIAAISMTLDRELQVDFSHRMFSGGLQIMTKPESAGIWGTFTSTVLTPDLLKAFMVVFAVILVIGHIVWLSMRKREDFPNDYIHGVGQGMWLIGSSLFVTSRISVVFFHGKEPSKVLTRTMIIVWMAVAVVIVAYVNGTITAALTVTELRSGIVSTSELPGVRVTTVTETQAAQWLAHEGIVYAAVEDVDGGIDRLMNGESDAFVFDSPILKWQRAQRPDSGLEVVGELFDPVPYGIALQQGSELREQINQTTLEMFTDGTYHRLLSEYTGQTP